MLLARRRSGTMEQSVEDPFVQLQAVGLAELLIEMDDAPHIQCVVERVVLIQEFDAAVYGKDDLGVLEKVQRVDGARIFST